MTTVYDLVVNGTPRRVEGAHAGDSLLHVLRDRLGLPGAKNACEQGECGSCSVLVDGVLVCACLELAEAAVGCAITTVEGLTPRFVVAIHDLLARVPEPGPLDVREALAGNLCRCTGYGRILAAVEQVVTVRTAAAIATEGAAG